MFFATFANFGVNPFETMKYLSLETMQPQVSSLAMHDFWTANLKLNRRVLTVNLLESLCSYNCGTNDEDYQDLTGFIKGNYIYNLSSWGHWQ